MPRVAQKMLVFGGSFDPPHRGHLALLLAAARKIQPGRILIVPGYHTPFKEAPGAPAADRLLLVRRGLVDALAAPLRRRTRVDQAELRARRKVYTVETLGRLAAENPGWELHFVTGSDAAAGFRRWRKPRRLAELARWWTGLRPGVGRRPPAPFRVLPGRMPGVSSTDVRGRLARGEDCAGELLPSVARAIEARGLYGRPLARELQRSLSSNRFAHTQAVARLAEALARRWREDPDKARLAGLLHDCGRAVAVPAMPAYARRHRLRVPDLAGISRHHPLLLHAYISEHLARTRFSVRDAAVLSAVRRHTLGAPRMSGLDRVLYVADACSEDRDYPEAAELRRNAFTDLDRTFADCVRNKLGHALSQGGWLHPLTIAVWNSLQE